MRRAALALLAGVLLPTGAASAANVALIFDDLPSFGRSTSLADADANTRVHAEIDEEDRRLEASSSATPAR